MALTIDFGPNDIRKQIEKTGIGGRHLTFVDDFSAEELRSLFKTAELLEPYWRGRIPLLDGKILCTNFFQPSTRTRFSHETAMYRLGGNVITESNPLVSSAAAKGESLSDALQVISQYAEVIVLRHPDENVVNVVEELGEGVSMQAVLAAFTRGRDKRFIRFGDNKPYFWAVLSHAELPINKRVNNVFPNVSSSPTNGPSPLRGRGASVSGTDIDGDVGDQEISS